MHLESLSLVNFKNYEQLDIELDSRINCFVGNNGVGKTNLLDAIYYLSLTKSYFNPVDSQNIKHNEDFFVIQGKFRHNESTENIYCGLKKNRKKQFKRNNKEYQRLAEHIGLIPVVMISPADSSLILDGSEERRKFINMVISQYDPEYLEKVIYYNRTLTQRNKLLKDFGASGRFDKDTLEIYNDQLAAAGTEIYRKRQDFTGQLVPIFQQFYNQISMGNEAVELVYQSHLQNSDFRELLKKTEGKDRVLEYTTAGIHKDDLVLNLDGFPIKKTGSQGQQKTYLVALKLAKFEFIRKIHNIKPVLLLDDIFDKFDAGRVKQIINLVAGSDFGQIFITDTSQSHLEPILQEAGVSYRLFNIDKEGIELK